MKTFVLDTNVLLHDPDSIFSFQDNKVVIPMAVIEELDSFKKFNDERGRSARLISRKLDALRSKGKLSDGVATKDGGVVKIEMNRREVELPAGFVEQKSDNQILSIALGLKQKGGKVIFITKDINLRIKSEILNIETQDYEKSKIKIDEIYTGWREISVPAEKIDQFYKDENLVLKQDFYPNEFIVLKDEAGSSKSALTKYSGRKKALTPIFHQNAMPWGGGVETIKY